MNIRIKRDISQVDYAFELATKIIGYDVDCVLVPEGNMYVPRFSITDSNQQKDFEYFESTLLKQLSRAEVGELADKIAKDYKASEIYDTKGMIYRTVIERWFELE